MLIQMIIEDTRVYICLQFEELIEEGWEEMSGESDTEE